MGSLSSQLCTVAEIRHDKVGHYAHFFRKMYGKFGKKIKKIFSKNRNNSTPNHFLRLKIGSNLHPMALHNLKDQIFDFRIVSLFTAMLWSKNGQKRPKTAIKWQKRAKNMKIKNLIPAIVEGHEMKILANFQPQKVIWC